MNSSPDENEWIRLIFLLADTQQWLNEICGQAIGSLHSPAKKLFSAKTYRLTIGGLAHILERHYYKTLRHPGTGKFDIPPAAIIDHIRTAASQEAVPVKGNTNFMRCLQLSEPIGTNKNGERAWRLIVITDPGGNIVTAFPE